MEGAARAWCVSQLPVSLFSGGVTGRSDSARDACRRRWARTIMRARMRNPCCNCARCVTVYATDDPFKDVVVLFDGFLLSALLTPLLRAGLGGMQADPSAVAAKQLAAIDQSADLGERAISLGGHYSDVMWLAAIGVSASPSQ